MTLSTCIYALNTPRHRSLSSGWRGYLAAASWRRRGPGRPGGASRRPQRDRERPPTTSPSSVDPSDRTAGRPAHPVPHLTASLGRVGRRVPAHRRRPLAHGRVLIATPTTLESDATCADDSDYCYLGRYSSDPTDLAEAAAAVRSCSMHRPVTAVHDVLSGGGATTEMTADSHRGAGGRWQWPEGSTPRIPRKLAPSGRTRPGSRRTPPRLLVHHREEDERGEGCVHQPVGEQPTPAATGPLRLRRRTLAGLIRFPV